VVMAVLDAREKWPRWGPKKLVVFLQRQLGKDTPSRATIARILVRFGQVRRRRRGALVSVIDKAPEVVASACNDVWTVDFKGWWRAVDGTRCEPLTVRDAYSRFVLCTKIVGSPTIEEVKAIFEDLFRRWGVPNTIQCDNGEPFISVQSRGGLSRLSAWWVSLGIRLARSRPACPQDNGGHERMHRDIRAEVQAFPQSDRISEQRALDRWRQEFNHVRPHEALAGKTPGEAYRKGERRSLRAITWRYPTGWIVKKAYGPNGMICVNGEQISVGRPFVGHTIALEPIGDRKARLWLHDVELGELLLPPSAAAIEGACARFSSRRSRPSTARKHSPRLTSNHKLSVSPAPPRKDRKKPSTKSGLRPRDRKKRKKNAA
jgi:putative transposase